MALAALAVAIAVPAAAPAADAGRRPKAPKLTVMTRNIFLGGDIAKPIPAQSQEEFERLAGELWQEVESTSFPARAKLLANEVKRTRPDLIGLQEVALWRRDDDNDGRATPATDVVYDFLAILRRELRKRKLRYRVGSVQREADIEGPTSLGFDMRLTVRDAILVRRRKGLNVRRRRGDNFRASLKVPTVVGEFDVLRGWTAVDATLAGRRFRFVNTHLEAFLASTRQEQARELIARGGPARGRMPVILVGDLNSDPTGADEGDPVPHRTLIDAGFVDTWTQINPRDPGWECCFESGLTVPPPAPFDHRIDHVLTKPRLKGLKARVIGDDPRNRSAGGLWPSDHGGVVTTLRLR